MTSPAAEAPVAAPQDRPVFGTPPGPQYSAPAAVEAPPIVAQPAFAAEDDGAPPIMGAASEEYAAPSIRPNGDSGRPSAPGLEPVRQSRRWLWAALGVVVLAIVVSAALALLWREKPQDLAIKEPTTDNAAKPSAPAQQGKIAERVATPAGGQSGPAPAADSSAPQQAAPNGQPGGQPATSAPGAAAAPGAETPIPAVPVTTVPVHPTDAGGQQSADATANQPAATPGVARAALLVETPNDPQKPKVDVGAATWTLVPAGTGPAQAAGPAVQADIDIPEMKMHVTVTIRKNVDASLPATHTIDLRLTFADGAEIKGFKDMGLPQMRRDDTPTGDQLSGVRVKINDAYFLVGLTRSDIDTPRNIDLLTARNWFDFPLVFPDDHVAKLTFEKGATGQSIIAQAMEAWK
jgi:hypothetical protein